LQPQASVGSAAADTVSGKDAPTPQDDADVESAPRPNPNNTAPSVDQPAVDIVDSSDASDAAPSPVMSTLNQSVRISNFSLFRLDQ
jgi:hypothetical protein